MNAIDPDVDDDGIGFDPIAFHHLWAANCDEQHVRASADVGEILCPGVRDGHGAVLFQQHDRQGLTYNVGSPQDYGMLSRQIVAQLFLGQDHATLRGARHQRIALTTHQQSGV
ncbi:hypothetical protein D9M68_766340 [compost metagenome]